MRANGMAQRQRRDGRDATTIIANSTKTRLHASGRAAVRLEPVLNRFSYVAYPASAHWRKLLTSRYASFQSPPAFPSLLVNYLADAGA